MASTGLSPLVSSLLLSVLSYVETKIDRPQRQTERQKENGLQRDAGSPGDGSQMAVLLIARPVIVARFARVPLMK